MYTVSKLNLFFKRLIDLVGSGLGLLLLSPLIVVIVLLMKITMPGPVF
jgi:lipopolysaccharide/colanic/teichoic acid biosynthesis glycosyltransferase